MRAGRVRCGGAGLGLRVRAGRRKKKTGCGGVRRSPWPREAVGESGSWGCSEQAVAALRSHAGRMGTAERRHPQGTPVLPVGAGQHVVGKL